MSVAVGTKRPAQRSAQAASGLEAGRAGSALSQEARGDIDEVRAVLRALLEDQPAHVMAKLRARLDDLLDARINARVYDHLDDIMDAHTEERAAGFRTSAHEGGYDIVEVYRYNVPRHSPMSGSWPRDRASSK